MNTFSEAVQGVEDRTASGKRETQFHSGEGDTFKKKEPDAATMSCPHKCQHHLQIHAEQGSPQHRSPMPSFTRRPLAPETLDHRESRGFEQEDRSMEELECGPIRLDLSPYSEWEHKLHWWVGLRCHPSSLATKTSKDQLRLNSPTAELNQVASDSHSTPGWVDRGVGIKEREIA